MCKAAKRPFPALTDDDVIDYLVTEAVAFKAQAQEQDDQKIAEGKQKQSDPAEYDKLRERLAAGE